MKTISKEKNIKTTAPVKSVGIKLSLRSQMIIVFVFSILLYGNTLFNKFTLDDTLIITQNRFTKMGIKGIGKIMSHDAFVGFFGENKNLLPGGRYRPLSQVIFAIEYQFAGLNPFPGHLINLLTYASLCIIVFLVLTKLFQVPSSKFQVKEQGTRNYLSIPFIATVLFVAHPLHTEAVANIKGLDEVLGMLLVMSSLFFVLKYIDVPSSEFQVPSLNTKHKARNTKLIYLSLIFSMFLLALLTKENTITFLAIIPLTLYVFRNISLKEHLIILSPIFIAIFIYFIIRYRALGFIFGNMTVERELLNNPYLYATVAEKYATIMLTLGKYLQLLILPYNLTHDYYPKQLPIIDWGDLRAVIPFLIYAALTLFALKNIFRKKTTKVLKTFVVFPQLIAYGILFFLITFSIQSNIIFNIGAFMNERFVFISILGFCLIVASSLVHLFISQKSKVIILLIILVGYSIKTFTRNFVWKDEFTLFTTDVKTSSNSAKCNVSAGGMYYEKAKKEKDSIQKSQLLKTSLSYLVKGVEIHPQYVQGWMLVGNVYLEMKDYTQARVSYENILKIANGNPDALNNLLFVAQSADKKNMISEAVISFKTLLRYKPGEPDYLYQYASALAKSGRVDTAIVILNNLIAEKPDYYNAYNKFGEIYGRYLHDMNKSLMYLNKALSLKADDASILENLGVAYGIVGQYDKSEYYFKKALKVKPDNPQVLMNLAGTYRNMGKIDLANNTIAKAKELEKKN